MTWQNLTCSDEALAIRLARKASVSDTDCGLLKGLAISLHALADMMSSRSCTWDLHRVRYGVTAVERMDGSTGNASRWVSRGRTASTTCGYVGSSVIGVAACSGLSSTSAVRFGSAVRLMMSCMCVMGFPSSRSAVSDGSSGSTGIDAIILPLRFSVASLQHGVREKHATVYGSATVLDKAAETREQSDPVVAQPQLRQLLCM